MDKIVLIYPSLLYSNTSNAIMVLPLSLIYIATPLRNDFDIKIIDQRVDNDWRNTLKKELRSGKTICAGISSMTGPQISGAIESASIIKKLSPALPLVWGGVHPSLTPEETIKDDHVDIVVIGDGEETFTELVHVIQNEGDKKAVKGIIYKDNRTIIRTPPRQPFHIGKLGVPAYDLIDIRKYKIQPTWVGENSLPILTSRGCPMRCSYCYNTQFSQRQWTSLTPEQSVALINTFVQKYNIKNIFLLDDNFFVNTKRVTRICNLLIENKMHINIYNANCRADSIAKMGVEYLRLIRKAGFKQLLVGVESGSDKILSRIKKDITLHQVLTGSTNMKNAGIKPIYSFMAGFPFESVEDIKQTLSLMNRLSKENQEAFVYKLQLYTPFPGTDLFDYATRHGMKFPQSLYEWANYHYGRLNYEGFTNKHKKFLKDMHYYTMFFNKKLSGHRNLISSLYSRLLTLRINHRFYSCMYELYPVTLLYKIRSRFRGTYL
ncbi:hypothetical protein AMJ44_07050 [candidate division WOR-1 bacterium DG_54_3]|uniref:Uncharacterized protein n=1 Tax=candidate division WOR-1 bacterium DG_54_3 TaxID=1703775 RepID=A0A0S7Y074_UNCSA|nr:MAG: hypothetical protein AMJ44_07050 [candidate division WOR-1 bacterium DG_54_3]